jgi:predicted acyltransferase
VGIPADWPHQVGFAAHWEKNTNVAAAFDGWFLNLFPRSEPFMFNKGGYQTLNFVPSLVTMILGLLAGRLLQSEMATIEKLKRLLIAGVVGIVLGEAISLMGVCPIVKRIWTPSWVLFSTGWVTLVLLVFVDLMDRRGWKRWAFPLVVVGLNPITLYCLSQLSGGFIRQQLSIHVGPHVFDYFGKTWEPLFEHGLTLLVLWLMVWWMYRRKIFVRL